MKEEKNKKGKRRGKGCLITVLALLVLLAIGGGIGWSLISKEHREARSLALNNVNFDKLNDGTYHGLYEGGMYRWRYNECDVSVVNDQVTEIHMTGSEDPGAENTDTEMLYERVVAAQSLHVDTISGATLTSKAYLQCVENALLPAQAD